MPVFYEVATLDNPVLDPPYALIRVDTDKRAGEGVEGIVVSLHWSMDDAKAAAEAALTGALNHG